MNIFNNIDIAFYRTEHQLYNTAIYWGRKVFQASVIFENTMSQFLLQELHCLQFILSERKINIY